LCSNNAKSCYNRIVLIIAALCLCRLGATTASVQSMVDTLAKLHHHIQTAFGDSERQQGQEDWDKPTAGIGQGNGAGPQIWAAVSLPLFDIMRQDGLVAMFICALSKDQRALAGFAFVDDTDVIVNGPTNNIQQVHQQMQKSLTMWHGLLQAMGSNLVPEKCFWYLLNFHWANNHWRYKTIKETPGQLMLQTETQTMIIIPRLEASEARQMLGVQLAPDGNDKDEARYLQPVAMYWKIKCKNHTSHRKQQNSA